MLGTWRTCGPTWRVGREGGREGGRLESHNASAHLAFPFLPPLLSLPPALQLDLKPSLIVDYGNGGGDEIRLVNSKKRIYLGR